MIIRSLALRHGRYAIARTSSPSLLRQSQRTFSIVPSRQEEQQEVTAARPAPAFGVSAKGQADDVVTSDWLFKQKQREVTTGIGAEIEPQYQHNDLLDNPLRPEEITLEILMASQCHLGHHTSLWHPGNSRYIHGTWGEEKEAIHIISLDATASHLRRACKVVTSVAEHAGLILFVGTRKGFEFPTVFAAKMARGYHLFERFKPGTFSNAEQLLKNCKRTVVNHLDEEQPGFDSQLESRAAIKPDLVVCLNPHENFPLLHECGLHNIPTIGIVDTDTNPTWVTYPIPANDDSLRSVNLIAGALGRAAEEGVATRMAGAQKGRVVFEPAADLKMPTLDDIEAWHRERKDTLPQSAQQSAEQQQTA